MIRQALVDMEFMFQLLDTTPEIQDQQGAHPLIVRAANIVFRNVHFAYYSDR